MESDTTVADNKFGKYSVRSQQRFKDFGAVNNGGQKYLVEEDYKYNFIHPHNQNVLVTIIYSERFAPGEQTPDSKIERDEFVNNVKIKPFSK
jgi:hypothetical protein